MKFCSPVGESERPSRWLLLKWSSCFSSRERLLKPVSTTAGWVSWVKPEESWLTPPTDFFLRMLLRLFWLEFMMF